MEAPSEHNVAHLTDEQFTDLLMGTKPEAVRAHLAACERCMNEAERVSGAIANFEQQSRLWTERHASAHLRKGAVRGPGLQWLLRPQMLAAAVLAVAVAVGVGTSIRLGSTRTVRPLEGQQAIGEVQPTAQVSVTTLKADNDLLSAIDGELSADGSTSASAYGLDAAPREVQTKAAKRMSN